MAATKAPGRAARPAGRVYAASSVGSSLGALAAGRVALLADHVAWLKVAHTSRGVPLALLAGNLRALWEELEESLPPPGAAMALDYVDGALVALDPEAERPTELGVGRCIVDVVCHGAAQGRALGRVRTDQPPSTHNWREPLSTAMPPSCPPSSRAMWIHWPMGTFASSFPDA